MKLNVSDLRKFKANSASIKTNSILPILSYLKFDKGTVTKNAMGSFVIQKIDCKESFLIDERILMNFISYTNSPTIDVKVTDKNIKITDGSTTVTSPTDDIAHFPTNDQPDGKSVQLDREVLEAVSIASNFTIEEEVPSPRSHVFIGKNCVCGSDGFVAYIDEFEEEVPEVVLKKATATAISKFDSLKFSQNESYHFFETDKCKFGFIKPDYKFFDLTPFGKFEKQGSFVIDKTDLINVNDMVVGATNAKYSIVKIEVKNNSMTYEMNDADYGVNIVKELPVSGEVDGAFNFNAALMNRLLKSVTDTMLTFNKVGERYYVTGDSGFVALINGFVNS